MSIVPVSYSDKTMELTKYFKIETMIFRIPSPLIHCEIPQYFVYTTLQHRKSVATLVSRLNCVAKEDKSGGHLSCRYKNNRARNKRQMAQIFQSALIFAQSSWPSKETEEQVTTNCPSSNLSKGSFPTIQSSV